HCRTAARIRRYDRTAARKGFEDRTRHVVDVRRLEIDVGSGVVAPDVVRRNASCERDVAESEFCREAAERRLLRTAPNQRQTRVRKAILDEAERSQRA